MGRMLKVNQSLKNKMKRSFKKKIFVYSSTMNNNLSMIQIAQNMYQNC
jgi:hypothetical protein